MSPSSYAGLILPELFQGGLLGFPDYALAILLCAFSFLLLLFGWRRWARQAFGGDESGKRSTLTWPLRPSNLLILLAAGFYIYRGLQYFVYRRSYSLRLRMLGILIVLAFVIRYWEDDAVRDVDDSGADVEKGEDPPPGNGKVD